MYIFLKLKNKLKNKIIKKNSNFSINNKLINGTEYLLHNDLIIKQLFKLDINKRNIIKHNMKVIKQIKPLSIFLISNKYIYKNFFKYE
tara:strand:+ start:413 stop:676 length:264 start_codon:yes stop_codon:yes gene_type:complete